jgi:hypothetical protein
MRLILLTIAASGAIWGQAMTEAAAAAAGGSIGDAAGKKVSEGISAVFQKVDQTTAKAAKATAPAKPVFGPGSLIQVGAGAPAGAQRGSDSVPPPPPLPHTNLPRPSAVPPPVVVAKAAPVAPLPPPPPPVVTADDLRNVAPGTSRDDLMRVGPWASRITMFDDGHLTEVYRYTSKETTVGVVRLADGAVSKVEVRR